MNLTPLVAYGLGGNYPSLAVSTTFGLLPIDTLPPTPAPTAITGGSRPYAPGTYKDAWKVIDPLYTLQVGAPEKLLTIKIEFDDRTLCDRTYRLNDHQFNNISVDRIVPTLVVATLSTPKLIKVEFK